jgi:hypothetical protein
MYNQIMLDPFYLEVNNIRHIRSEILQVQEILKCYFLKVHKHEIF